MEKNGLIQLGLVPTCMRFFLCAFLLTTGFLSHADNVMSQVWNCTLEASLVGDGDFFLRYGRDSWKGDAVLNCTSQLRLEQKPVAINFNGLLRGFGVNDSSVISLVLNIVTSNEPAKFEVYSPVFNHDLPAIIWRSESGGILVEANVVSADSPGVQASLQQGNLYIR